MMSSRMSDSETNAKMQALELEIFKKYITEKIQLYLNNFEKVQANITLANENGWRLGKSYGFDGKKRAEDYLNFVHDSDDLEILLLDVASDLVHNYTQSPNNTIKNRLYDFGCSMWQQAKYMSGYAEVDINNEPLDQIGRLGSSRELAKMIAHGYYNALQASYLAKVNRVLSHDMKQQFSQVLNQCALVEDVNIIEGDLVLAGSSGNRFVMRT